MTRKLQGYSLCLLGGICILLAAFSDILAKRELTYGPLQIFLFIIGIACIVLGILLIRGILKLPNIGEFLTSDKPKPIALEVDHPIAFYLIVWVFCLFISLIFLMICTKSSPLYPFNDWVDANIFFTMGKGMMNNKIPYRDLFDHKGPLLYLIHGIAYKIANTSFLGVFVLEVLAFSVFLLFCFKLLIIYLDHKYSLIALPLIASGILNLKSFHSGDSAEEFCLPLLMISLVGLINYFKNTFPKPMPARQFFLNGLIIGCVLWIKYSLLGFWIGWVFSISICMISQRQFSRLLRGYLFLALGIMITTLPWFIYFGFNNSISHWLDTYFVYNLTYYQVSKTFIERILYTLIRIGAHLKSEPIFSILLWFGIFTFFSSRFFINNLLNRFLLLLSIALVAFGIYGGGHGHALPYYFLILTPFIIFAFVVILKITSRLLGDIRSKNIFAGIFFFIIILTSAFSFRFNKNIDMIKIEKDDLVQYKFASIINELEGSTLLNYGTLDHGFYTAAGITPNVRFFMNPNIDYAEYPLIMDEQNRYIKEKIVDFVVIRVSDLNNFNYLSIPFFSENYHLVRSEKQVNINDQFYFLLFKKNL